MSTTTHQRSRVSRDHAPCFSLVLITSWSESHVVSTLGSVELNQRVYPRIKDDTDGASTQAVVHRPPDACTVSRIKNLISAKG